MPAYTYLMEIHPKSGDNWARLLEPRTGTVVDGTFGVVEVKESGLPRAAEKIMKGWASTGLRLRVSFWEGRRVNEKLYASEVCQRIYDDGTIHHADAIAREISERAGNARPATVRPGCPHAPHDGSCGVARPICPSCLNEERQGAGREVVAAVRRAGDAGLVLRCSSCEQLSFQFDAGLICDVCQCLVPHVNEELADRFTVNGGAFAARPGSCPGCADQMPGPEGPLSFGCPKCGTSVILNLDSLTPGASVMTMCPSKECGMYISIPPSIWCPECGQHQRPLRVIRTLTLAANDVRLATRSNVREDETTQLARRLAEVAESCLREYDFLTPEQRKLLLDKKYRDAVSVSGVTPDEWIRGSAEIRAIGRELHQMGGMHALQQVHQRVMEQGADYHSAARYIELCWDGIGAWLG
jgi:hypothetical protein